MVREENAEGERRVQDSGDSDVLLGSWVVSCSLWAVVEGVERRQCHGHFQMLQESSLELIILVR